MSELKAISGHEISEDIDYNTRGIDPEDKEWNNYGKELCDTLYYLKSEADKVIAEKDAEIAELKDKLQNVSELLKETREWLIESQKLHKRCADNAIKTIRHHKHKLCLDKAEMCQAKYDKEDAKVNGRGASWDYTSPEMKYWERWQRRWLELADKFKEAK